MICNNEEPTPGAGIKIAFLSLLIIDRLSIYKHELLNLVKDKLF
jgi:hypothetical protein